MKLLLIIFFGFIFPLECYSVNLYSDEKTAYYLLSIILIISTIFIFVYYKLKRVAKAINIDGELIYIYREFASDDNVGYYYLDEENNIEDFSDKLKEFFSIDNNATLEVLKQFTNKNDFNLLSNLVSELKENLSISKKNYNKIFPNSKNLNQNFSNSIKKAQISIELADNNIKFFDCIGEIVSSELGRPNGIIIWFKDITEYFISYNKLSTENEKLKLELKKLNKILNVAPFAIWERDNNLNITYFNFPYSQIIAQEADQALEADMLEIDKQSKQFATIVKKTNMQKSEERHIIANGKRCLYHMTEIPVEDGSLIGFAYDITSKEEIKKELERHICAQSELLESSANATAIYGADTRLKFFNQAFVKLWQFDEIWLSTQPTYGEVLEELREKRKLPEQANFPLFKQTHLNLFTELIKPYNEFFYLPEGKALRVIVIPHALGGLLFTYEDMTDRLALERSYNTLIAVQKATLDNLHEGVAVFAENGRLKLSNPTYASMWGLSTKFLSSEPHITEILERIKLFFSVDENWEQFKISMLSTLSKRERSTKQFERGDGTVINRITVPLPDGATLITHVDITDSMLVERSLRERNEALQDADRIKTEFLANVSYELRSPLTSIMGLSEALGKEYFGDLNERQKEYVNGIYNSSQYLMSLINDILDLASIEAGYLKLEISRFDLYKATSSMLPLIKERIKELDIKFKFECDEEFGLIVGDERRIKQVIFKLLSNAIEFNKVGGEIKLIIEKEGDQKVKIVVEDNGIGIAPTEQVLVFNKFYKQKDVKNKSGAGLGLAVVKSFIELHEGRVYLESVEGVGTKVICILDRDNQNLLQYLN